MSVWNLRITVFMSVVLTLGGFLPAASFQGLGFLSSQNKISEATGISADGSKIIGSGLSDQGQRGFVWTRENGMMVLPDGMRNGATAISADGSRIVGSCQFTDGKDKPVMWDGNYHISMLPSSTVSQGNLIEKYGYAADMSADGSMVVGLLGSPCYWDSGNTLNFITLPVTVYTYTNMAISPDGNKILIGAYTQNGQRTYIGSPQEGFSVLLDQTMNSRFFSGDSHYVIGEHTVIKDNVRHIYSFRWNEEGGVDVLDELDGYIQTTASCANENGSMIGGVARLTQSDPVLVAFLWQEGQGTRLLKDVLADTYGLDIGDWQLGGLTGISNDGAVLCGWGTNPEGFQEAWVAVIPEPATFVLLAAGAFLLKNRR